MSAHRVSPFVVALVTLGVALAFVYPRQWSRGFLVNEEMYFATLASNIASGEGYVTYAIDPFVADEIDALPIPEFTRPPGYSGVLALAFKAGISNEVAAGIALSLSWLVITIVAFYSIASGVLRSWRGGLLLCGIYLASETTLVHGTTTRPEMQLDGLLLLTFWALLHPTRLRSFTAGLCSYLALATNMLAVAYMPLVPAFLVWHAIATSRREGTRSGTVFDRVRGVGAYLIPWAGGIGTSLILVSTFASIPSGAQVETFNRYSFNFMHETSAFPTVGSPWHHLDPPSSFDYFWQNPDELVSRTARLVSRTPTVLNEVGAMPLRGSLAALFLLVIVATSTLGWPQADPRVRRFLWLGLIAFVATLPTVWTYLVRVRYFYQVYPLMLLAIAAQCQRFQGDWMRLPQHGRRAIAAAFVAAVIVYPIAWTVRETYTHPNSFLGRGLAVHILDYPQLADDLRQWAPPGSTVVTDFAYEIPWLTGNPTIFPPIDPIEFRWVIDKFDAKAVALRHGRGAPHRQQLSDFREAIERPGYSVFVRE